MHTVQMGKLWYKAINIIVCLWNNKKIKENKTNTYSAKKIFSHPNSMIKILSAKKRIFFRFQLYAWGYCVYMDTMLLDRREYPVNKENTCSKWNFLPLLPTKKSHNTLHIPKSTLDELCCKIFQWFFHPPWLNGFCPVAGSSY